MEEIWRKIEIRRIMEENGREWKMKEKEKEKKPGVSKEE